MRPIPLQGSEAGVLLADIAPEQRMRSWHLVSPVGERLSGGAAIPAFIGLLPRGRVPAAIAARFPAVLDHGYRWVAEHRSQLSKLVPASAKARLGARLDQHGC